MTLFLCRRSGSIFGVSPFADMAIQRRFINIDTCRVQLNVLLLCMLQQLREQGLLNSLQVGPLWCSQEIHRLSQLLTIAPRAVALIAISSRRYFENLEPPIGAFASQMSHLFQKPTANAV